MTPAEQMATARLRQLADAKYSRRMAVLAERLHWSRSRLSRTLSGQQPMTVADLAALCTALETTPAAVLSA